MTLNFAGKPQYSLFAHPKWKAFGPTSVHHGKGSKSSLVIQHIYSIPNWQCGITAIFSSKLKMFWAHFDPFKSQFDTKLWRLINRKTARVFGVQSLMVWLFGVGKSGKNDFLFQNVLSFSKCGRFCECCFSFFPKNTIVNKNLYIHYK